MALTLRMQTRSWFGTGPPPPPVLPQAAELDAARSQALNQPGHRQLISEHLGQIRNAPFDHEKNGRWNE
jgi:hypothetical protein